MAHEKPLTQLSMDISLFPILSWKIHVHFMAILPSSECCTFVQSGSEPVELNQQHHSSIKLHT